MSLGSPQKSDELLSDYCIFVHGFCAVPPPAGSRRRVIRVDPAGSQFWQGSETAILARRVRCSSSHLSISVRTGGLLEQWFRLRMWQFAPQGLEVADRTSRDHVLRACSKSRNTCPSSDSAVRPSKCWTQRSGSPARPCRAPTAAPTTAPILSLSQVSLTARTIASSGSPAEAH